MMAAKKLVAKKITGDPEIDAVAASLEKQFGRLDFITRGPGKKRVIPIPTGSLALDIALGIGGIPRSRIIEIFGPESSGKTSLAIKIAERYDKLKHTWGDEDRWILIVDVEHTITLDLLEGIGLDPKNIIFVTPDTGEQALQAMIDFCKTGRIGLAILDSIDAIQTEAQLKKKMGENEMGGASKILNRFMREFSKTCSNTETTAIFINQLKYNPGAMFGSPEVTPGGTGPKFYASLRLKTLPGKPSKNRPSFSMRVRTIKNKVAPPRQEPVQFEFLYAEGPDEGYDIINAAKELDIAYHAGSSFMVRWPGEADATKIASGNTDAVRDYLVEHPELLAKLRNACLEVAGVPSIGTGGSIEVEADDAETVDETTNT